MTYLKPLEVVLEKEDKNKYSIELKWIMTGTYESTYNSKKEAINELYWGITDFFPNWITTEAAERKWNAFNSDIPYEIGKKYLQPYSDILHSTKPDNWNEKTIPLKIITNADELREVGAVFWHQTDFYWNPIREKFGENETLDWDFDNENEMIEFMNKENIPLPDTELVNRTRVEWLKIKKILK